MRGVNAYQALNDTHERLQAETKLPGLRYEQLRDTQQEVDLNPAPALLRVIDNLETRLAGLDQELTELRESGRGPGRGAGEQDQQSDIDRALALQPGDGQERENDTRAPGELDDYVAPEHWTDQGGMVENNASANDWHKHIEEVRRERAGRETPDPAAHDLSQEDRELLAAARISEAHAQQQEHGPSHGHEPPSP
jgi:hypothetical protein